MSQAPGPHRSAAVTRGGHRALLAMGGPCCGGGLSPRVSEYPSSIPQGDVAAGGGEPGWSGSLLLQATWSIFSSRGAGHGDRAPSLPASGTSGARGGSPGRWGPLPPCSLWPMGPPPPPSLLPVSLPLIPTPSPLSLTFLHLPSPPPPPLPASCRGTGDLVPSCSALQCLPRLGQLTQGTA